MIESYHLTSFESREVFLSEEIKKGFGKFPNWLMDLVDNGTIPMEASHFWVKINNVPPGFRFRRAALITKTYSKWQVDKAINCLLEHKLIREIRKNSRNISFESIDLEERCPETRQTLSGNSTNVVRIPDTNKTISKNINNGENSPKESPALTPLRGGLNIDHLIEPGTRRDRLEDSIERILGFELMPGFFKWLEADFMKDKTRLPIRAYTKKRRDILELAKLYLSQEALGYIINENSEV